MPLLDEEVRDGTLAAQHKAVILTSLDYLDPDVIAGLEEFARQGGLVLLTGRHARCKSGRGQARASLPKWPDAAQIAELSRSGQSEAANKLMQMRQVGRRQPRRLAAAIGPSSTRRASSRSSRAT